MKADRHNSKNSLSIGRSRLQAAAPALLAALLYGMSTPASKLLLKEISPALLASLLYLGAGSGMLVIKMLQLTGEKQSFELPLTRRELPYTIAMIGLDIVAPILLMFGLKETTSANASLLNNFEIVATSLIALIVFKETIGRRMWLAITFITLASILLTFNSAGSLSFSRGSVLVLLAAACWGLENNCTRVLSKKDPLQIVVIKGLGSGLGSLIIAFAGEDMFAGFLSVVLALLLGFASYGLSIFFYIKAQRELHAARTSAYFALAPFIGVILSWIFLGESISGIFIASLIIMLLGIYFALSEKTELRQM